MERMTQNTTVNTFLIPMMGKETFLLQNIIKWTDISHPFLDLPTFLNPKSLPIILPRSAIKQSLPHDNPL
jgi:hypothetical protein